VKLDDASLISQLLALLAHDLRNPLSALHSNAGYLQAAFGGDGGELHEALDDVVSSCASLGHIIDNLELLGLSMDASTRFERVPLSLTDIVTEAVEQCRSLAASYRVEIRVTPEPSAAATLIQVNRDMMRRALVNLIRNAIQHGAREAPIEIRVQRREQAGVIGVEDAGSSLAPELAESAFTARGQLDCKSHPGGRYSRGLGLFAAAVSARAAGAELSTRAPRPGFTNAFELAAPLAEL
jgi:two-component system heavy metal sensor histidine kinase CusS